jgi:hypothetical protein
MSETEISYEKFLNRKKRVAIKRFRQELSVYCGKMADTPVFVTKTLTLVPTADRKLVSTIIHDESSNAEKFSSEMKKLIYEFGYINLDFVLDGVKFPTYFWLTSTFDRDEDGYPKERSTLSFDGYIVKVCWICNRLYMKPVVLVHHEEQWHFLKNSSAVWCSEECQVKFASYRLSEKRKAERHSIDKTTTCRLCGCNFTPKRQGAKFCSTKCRTAAHRKGSQR